MVANTAPGRGAGLGLPTALCGTHELHDQPEFMFAQQRVERTDDPDVAADRDSLPHRERFLAAQVPGRDNLIAAAQLVTVLRHTHSMYRPAPTQPRVRRLPPLGVT